MSGLTRLWKSSLGKKYLVALTGVALFFFVVAHLLGNLQIFLGREAINKYGALLQANQALLWPARIGLLVMVVVHIAATISLAIENLQARETAYEVKKIVKSTLASRTMVYTGLIVFAFIGFHLAHFTLQVTHPEYQTMHDAAGRHDVYGMMIAGFSKPLITGFYLLGVGLLSLHLSHGANSMFQSLGIRNELLPKFAKAVALLLFLGYASIPAAVLLKVVQ